jgi:acetyl-CoA carboxylase carboxyltransferase component
VTGIGRVSGREVMVIANDATVKGGTYFPLHVKKHLRAQEIAEQNRLACVYLVDSGGAFLPLQATSFPTGSTSADLLQPGAHVGQRIRRSPIVMGSCTAGARKSPRCRRGRDREGDGHDLPGGAPAREGGDGEEVTAEELGGADVHTRISGVADHLADDDAHALEIARAIVANLGGRQDAAGRSDRAGGAGLRPEVDLRRSARGRAASPTTCAT